MNKNGYRMPKPKIKCVEILLHAHHLPVLKGLIPGGIINISNPLWLTAFAAYNSANTLKLSPMSAIAYETVYNFIENKLK
ncbi:MAG: hypothetical protein BWY74_03277 [Firmicutes bacterium ADurb.Bin419]|nr:MAG: hypothetical protein BWY74_03277 [Firmicutes bacterium ADurb.Bin419]